jgi:hypothetical protein
MESFYSNSYARTVKTVSSKLLAVPYGDQHSGVNYLDIWHKRCWLAQNEYLLLQDILSQRCVDSLIIDGLQQID